MDYRSTEIIIAIARKVGTLECYKKSSADDPMDFVQFKTKIDIAKPLLQGIHTKLNNKGMWIPFTYEALSLLCFNCGKIGYFVKSCVTLVRDETLTL